MTKFPGVTHNIVKLLLWKKLLQPIIIPEEVSLFIFLGTY